MTEGFYIVIMNDKGRKDVCYGYVDGDYTAVFESEESADTFCQEVRKDFPHVTYYWKYVPWGEFA